MVTCQTPEHIDAEEAVCAPRVDRQERRRSSLATTRPVMKSRPLGWMFVGTRLMPRSEHLIPFLN